MSNRTLKMTDRLYEYLLATSLREPELLQQLRKETASHEWARMQISPEQGQFLALLLKLLGARRAIEVGVFTGYSALVTALAMGAGSRLVACDISEEFTNTARRYWDQAGVADRIELQLRPATETLAELNANNEAGKFDFAFIDADKGNYEAYYEALLPLIRRGGLIAVDNVLWSGRVAQADANDEDTVAIRAFNERRLVDERVDLSMVPIADGLSLLRKI